MNAILKQALSRLSVVLGLGLAALSAQAKLNVVATLPDLGAIAQRLGGKQIQVTTLARPTEDPHFVDPKPSFIVKLNRADVLIEGGAELEIGWLPPLVQSARNASIQAGAPGRVVCNHGIAMLGVPATLDRSQGDIHAHGNPHYLTDPANARIVATNITEAFCRMDASGCEEYRANLKSFITDLDAKLAEWEKLMQPCRDKRLVAYHDSWPYFAQRFGLKIDLFLEPKPGIPPSPSHLAALIGEMKAQQIRVIIVDPYQNRRAAETLARNTEAAVVDVAQFPGGLKGTEGGYLELMDRVVRAVARALTGP